MLTLYFSGTGNSKYIAERFSRRMKAVCHSIEEEMDFAGSIIGADTIAFCYPIYGSCVPRIMREFVTRHKALLDGKKLVILCTQKMFSGDGARVFTDLLDGVRAEIIYAEHIDMPNNIGNFPLIPVINRPGINKRLAKADRRVDEICSDIEHGIVRLRGFNIFSKWLGRYVQRAHFKRIEKKAAKDVRVSTDCIACGKCVELCPMHNLVMVDKKVVQQGNCTICFRCVNACPRQAITVMLHQRVRQQYRGP